MAISQNPNYFYKKGDDAENEPDISLRTVGIRTTGDIGELLDFTGELAGQTGYYGGEDRQGLGFNGVLSHTFDYVWKPSLALNYVYLSGDDPDTSKNEDWDPLLSRWPKWSELYIYSLVKENGVAYWSNSQISGLSLGLQPTDKMNLSLWYQHLWANENPFESEETIYGDGDSRGDLVQACVKYAFTESLSGHLWGEVFSPGDYYDSNADTGYFMRWELMYKF